MNDKTSRGKLDEDKLFIRFQSITLHITFINYSAFRVEIWQISPGPSTQVKAQVCAYEV